MAASLKVPTTFTAIDRFTSVLGRMTKAVGAFGSKAEASGARAERMFRRLTPSIGSAAKEIMGFASTAAIAAGLVFSGKALIDYEKKLKSFRTVVSDLDNNAFKPYQQQIDLVSKTTRQSAIDVAESFGQIAGLNSDFAKTAEGLGLVSKAAIILSKASGLDLATSTEGLVGIMSQFDLGVKESDRVINVLAAGLKYGSATIGEQSEAFKNFGTVAKTANLSLEQSVALVQVLGKYQIKGAEAGTKARSAIVKLQKAGAGYQSGQFKINDALEQVQAKVAKLTTAKQKDALMTKIFGEENLVAGKILLGNIPLFNQYTNQVSGTDEAHRAALINTDSFINRLTELKNQWINYITSNSEASAGLEKIKNIILYVTDNLDSLVSTGIDVLKFFGAFTALVWGARAAIFAYNVYLGVSAALNGTSSAAILTNSVAMGAASVVTFLAAAANWALAAALAAVTSPIFLIVAAIAAAIAIWYYWDEIVAWFVGMFKKHVAFITGIWDAVVEAFTKFSFKDMFMIIGKSIVDFFLFPLKAVLSLASKIPGAIGKGAASALGTINDITGKIFVADDTKKKPALGTPQSKAEELKSQNPQNGTLDVNFNDTEGRIKSTSTKGPLVSNVRVGTTQGAK